MHRPSVADAVSQIAEIHGQIAKGEVYRGWRATPVALSGIVGLSAAWLQRRGLVTEDPLAFVIFWSGVAAAAAVIGVSEILYALWRNTSFERRQTLRVAQQLVPPFAVAALVTATFIQLDPGLVVLLPGLWAMLYGLAIFAARPYLPRASGLVALYYAACGTTLLWGAHSTIVRSPWAVGGVFGVGQLFAAGVLYWNLERRP
ncbi:MAG TPA: hypothetical protein VH679_04750 [Vicinamibacterales bacterium]|jgi:hypothetical protein